MNPNVSLVTEVGVAIEFADVDGVATADGVVATVGAAAVVGF